MKTILVFGYVYGFGRLVAEGVFASNHFGDAPGLRGRCLAIPYRTRDPEPVLRKRASRILASSIRPRSYLREKVARFHEAHMRGGRVIGVHMRGTDSISSSETRYFRRGSLDRAAFLDRAGELLAQWPGAKVFVATDEAISLEQFRERFGDPVLACDTNRHVSGEPAGRGPLGKLMPAYLTEDPETAVRNGEEAIVECLLLSRCDVLLHNGASLARTALLFEPELAHENLNPNTRLARTALLAMPDMPHINTSKHKGLGALGIDLKHRAIHEARRVRRLLRSSPTGHLS